MMEQHVQTAALALVQALEQSETCARFAAAKELAFQTPHIRAVYEEYKRLQVQLQANALAGKHEEAEEKRLQQLTEVLHFHEDASAFLLAEYALQRMLGELYQMLAQAAGLDATYLDE